MSFGQKDFGKHMHEILRIPSKPPNIEFLKHNLNKEEIKQFMNKDSLLTDITCLLNLTQRVAANILGLSESGLCKKFKQNNANKKWPYRRIQKIEKKIKCTNDKNEIYKLIEKKNKTLIPAYIYLTRFYTIDEIEHYITKKKQLNDYNFGRSHENFKVKVFDSNNKLEKNNSKKSLCESYNYYNQTINKTFFETILQKEIENVKTLYCGKCYEKTVKNQNYCYCYLN